MSAKARSKMIWSIPVVALASTLASWLAVRGLAVPPAAVVVPTFAVSSGAEIGDPSLRALIGRFAASARAQSGHGAEIP
jgi:hypothetical protein